MWQVIKKFTSFIRFAVFCVHEYCFHDYILTIIVQSCLFYSQRKNCFYDKFNFLFQILINILDWSKLKQKVLGSLFTIIFSSMIIMTWLNCCKLFLRFYYADTKDTVFAWFHFLICMDCFQHLFVQVLLEVWFIICLELKLFKIIFLLLLPLHHLLVVALVYISQFFWPHTIIISSKK